MSRSVSIFFIVLLCCPTVHGQEKQITISDSASYYDEKIIAPNIRSECTMLGRQFSDSTTKFLTESRWNVDRAQELPEQGLTLELEITNAFSGGNAWAGHKKSVSIEARLFENGVLVDTYGGMRNSSGGFAGGFKNSCDVLQRCVNTLGKDVSKWLNKKR